MRTLLFILSLAGFILPTAAVAQRYSHNLTSINAPLLKKQFDSKLGISYSTTGGTSRKRADSIRVSESDGGGVDVQGVIALTNRFSIQVNYYYRLQHGNDRSDQYFLQSSVKTRQNLLEAGLGYMFPIDKYGNFFFRLNAAVGFGKTSIREHGTDTGYHFYNRYYDASIFKIQIEPSFNFYRKAAVAVSFVTRASFTKYGNVQNNYSKREKIDLKIDSLDRFSVIFIEPAIISSFGLNKLPGLRLECQVGTSFLAHHSFIGSNDFNVAIGLVFDIPKLIKGRARRLKD